MRRHLHWAVYDGAHQRLRTLLLLLVVAVLMQGCGSIAKGVTEGVLAAQEDENSTAANHCYIEGPPFTGITADFADDQDDPLDSNKVLIVHGIGNQVPGYSYRLQKRLAVEMGLEVRIEEARQFLIKPPAEALLPSDTDQELAHLRVTRWISEEESKEILFYELTWSTINEDAKNTLDYDTSPQYAEYRSDFNQALKVFFNERVPDTFIYLGNQKDTILQSVRQGVCWMLTSDWEDLPSEGTHSCSASNPGAIERMRSIIKSDEMAIITHSLGSRATIDALQSVALNLNQLDSPEALEVAGLLREQFMPVYMLSNQLALLQLGSEVPPVIGQKADYCFPEGSRFNGRLFRKTQIVAFSDPNDLLSFPIQGDFERNYLDSRICADIVNVVINVTPPVKLPVVGFVANPMEAHTEYETDERVIKLIADGVNPSAPDYQLPEGCTWMETRKDTSRLQ